MKGPQLQVRRNAVIRIAASSAAVTLLWIIAVSTEARACDDAGPPLYVIREGQRVPTLVVARPATAGVRPAVLEVVDLRGNGAAPGEPAAGDTETPWPEDEEGWVPPVPYRYELGYYAGYPVSIYRRGGERWWVYEPYLQPGYRRALEEAYRAGRYIAQREAGRRFNRRDMKQRKTRILNNHERALRAGLEYLRNGEYARAVLALSMAADLNQGDPACRIHLAQARLAQGHYEEAGAALRRALQLQPKLRFLSLHLESYYPDEAEFDRHVDALSAWVQEHRTSADVYFLLGYMEFQRDDFEAAYAAFRVAQRGMPRDALTRSYLELTKPPAR